MIEIHVFSYLGGGLPVCLDTLTEVMKHNIVNEVLAYHVGQLHRMQDQLVRSHQRLEDASLQSIRQASLTPTNTVRVLPTNGTVV